MIVFTGGSVSLHATTMPMFVFVTCVTTPCLHLMVSFSDGVPTHPPNGHVPQCTARDGTLSLSVVMDTAFIAKLLHVCASRIVRDVFFGVNWCPRSIPINRHIAALRHHIVDESAEG